MRQNIAGNSFKIGDTAMLRSGGHLMTVVSVDGNDVTCAWSVRDDVKTKLFPSDALIKGEKPQTIEGLLRED